MLPVGFFWKGGTCDWGWHFICVEVLLQAALEGIHFRVHSGAPARPLGFPGCFCWAQPKDTNYFEHKLKAGSLCQAEIWLSFSLSSTKEQGQVGFCFVCVSFHRR